MSKIDTSKWKDFKIDDLFVKLDLKMKKNTFNKATDVSLVKNDEYSLPLVNAKHFNNGIMYYGKPEDYESASMTIDVVADGAASTGDVYAQPQETGVLYNAYLIKLIGYSANEFTLLYLSCVLQKTIKQKFGYNNKCGWEKLRKLTIKLPVDENHQPDFSYMESYMKNRKIEVSASLTKLKSAKRFSKSQNIPTDRWKPFHIYDIFNIDSGTKLDKVKMDTSEREVNFVGRSNKNNGITERVAKIKGLQPYSAGYLTLALGGEYLGSCFIQPMPFYTSQNVAVLIPKDEISFLSKQFIATAIFIESQNNYRAFIKELNAHIKKDFAIKLPVDKNGNPDYVYMENYMKTVETNSHCILSGLKAV